MKLLRDYWAFILYYLDALTLSPHGRQSAVQQPLEGVTEVDHAHYKGPYFSPPHGPDDFFCNYTAMGPSWKKCSTPSDRGCWLTNGTSNYSIHTNYEAHAPKGTLRQYKLNVTDFTFVPDGYKFTQGKTFNNTYPGPWITACWGDEIEVTVENDMKFNGTTVHWHGIRQLHSMEMDGVNGVTQCPIAPGEKMTYRFKALQYGTTWYHSHYSLQYPDGAVGPMTLFGPSSANWDEAVDPILLTDWNHKSAFELFYKEIDIAPPGTRPPGPPKMESILLNGKGRWNCSQADKAAKICKDKTERFGMTFEKGKRYLLRLINTSVDTTFIFSIDGHKVKVMSSDFVPIKPYTTNSVLIGIGQRYHVVIEANHPGPPKNYWIRTIAADDCSTFNKSLAPWSSEDFWRTGILSYAGSDKSQLPTTSQNKFPTACSDEPYESLIPIVPWKVGKPANQQEEGTFVVGIAAEKPAPPLPPGGLNLSRWEMGKQSLWLDFADPTIAHVNTGVPPAGWPPQSVVVPPCASPESCTDNSWIYLLVTTSGFPFGNPNRRFIPASHPIHLHGHDFAILAQSKTPYWPGTAELKFDNPPRRDVFLLSQGGYGIIAFKSDNPGAWLMHCHIAWHASAGLAVEILERDGEIRFNGSGVSNEAAIAESKRICQTWNDWFSVPSNRWTPDPNTFQDDSGI